MENIDRVASRVTIAAFLGTLAGVGTSMYRGTPMRRTVGLTAFSCAMTGTVCFGAERCATIVAKNAFHREDNDWDNVLLCHWFGGLVGGSILGTLYIGKPTHGILFFTPLMMLVGTGEKLFEDAREERIQRILKQTQSS